MGSTFKQGCLLVVVALLVAGCRGGGGCRPHTDYQSSRPTEPLRAPDGLQLPDGQSSLPVPAGPRQPVTRTPDGRCLMAPPSFYVTDPNKLDADPQYAQAIVLDTGAFTTEVDALVPEPSGGAALVGASRLTIEIADFLSAWAETWSRREAQAWFEFYDGGYFPSGYDSSEAWRQTQAERFSIPAVTVIVYETLEVEGQPNGDVRAQFVQRFGEEPNTRSVLKALVLTPGGGKGWSIIGERIIDVL